MRAPSVTCPSLGFGTRIHKFILQNGIKNQPAIMYVFICNVNMQGGEYCTE